MIKGHNVLLFYFIVCFASRYRLRNYGINKNERGTTNLRCQVWSFQLGMALPEKLFEERGNVEGSIMTSESDQFV
jgi:hypothetical protein